MSPCWVRVGMPVEGPVRWTSMIDGRDLGVVGEAEQLVHQRDARPEVEVKARAPLQEAPSTMPIAAISSSAWMIR